MTAAIIEVSNGLRARIAQTYALLGTDVQELCAHVHGLERVQVDAERSLLDLLSDFAHVRTDVEDAEDAFGVCVLEQRQDKVLLCTRRHTSKRRASGQSVSD